MSELIATFKACLDESARAVGVNWHYFRRQKGIDDFLMDAAERGDSPKQLAARFLADCCDGRTTNDKVVCLAAINFLDTVLAKRPKDEGERRQRLKDCVDVATNPGTYDECLKWADAWF